MSEVDTYKIYRQLEERRKRANPYTFYDKDELIDEILKDEDEIERLNNIIKEVRDFVESMEYCGQEDYFYDLKAKDECGNDNTFNDSKHKLLEILDKGE